MFLSRKKGWIGIELGTRALKLVQLERTGGGPRIGASAVVRRTPGSPDFPERGSHGCAWSGRQIATALALSRGFSGRIAACVLPMRLTDLHTVSVPVGRLGERRAMVAHQLLSLFPEDGARREFDFWDVRTSSDVQSKDAVNVLSVSHGVANRVVRGLSQARLRCETIDGLPFALARAVKLIVGSGSEAVVGAVDWGFGGAVICVTRDGRPLFTRHVRNCGFELVTNAVSEVMSLSEEDVIQVLAKHGLPDPDSPKRTHTEVQDVVAEVAVPRLNELVAELKKTLHYLSMQYPDALPTRYCLLGDGAIVKNVTALLSHKLQVPVELWRMPCTQTVGRGRGAEHSEILGTAAALSALAWTR
jgi:Tfp pilus assembly PilM family ATPase